MFFKHLSSFKCSRLLVMYSVLHDLLNANAIATNDLWAPCDVYIMLWSQIIYRHRTAFISPTLVQFFGAHTAPGRRQEESYDLYQFLDIVRYPVKLRYYLKFHSARTMPGRCPAGVCTHRTGTRRFLFKIYIVRFQRCPFGHRTGITRC